MNVLIEDILLDGCFKSNGNRRMRSYRPLLVHEVAKKRISNWHFNKAVTKGKGGKRRETFPLENFLFAARFICMFDKSQLERISSFYKQSAAMNIERDENTGEKCSVKRQGFTEWPGKSFRLSDIRPHWQGNFHCIIPPNSMENLFVNSLLCISFNKTTNRASKFHWSSQVNVHNIQAIRFSSWFHSFATPLTCLSVIFLNCETKISQLRFSCLAVKTFPILMWKCIILTDNTSKEKIFIWHFVWQILNNSIADELFKWTKKFTTYRSCKLVILPISFGMLPLMLFHIKFLGSKKRTKIKQKITMLDDNLVIFSAVFSSLLVIWSNLQYHHIRKLAKFWG